MVFNLTLMDVGMCRYYCVVCEEHKVKKWKMCLEAEMTEGEGCNDKYTYICGICSEVKRAIQNILHDYKRSELSWDIKTFAKNWDKSYDNCPELQ